MRRLAVGAAPVTRPATPAAGDPPKRRLLDSATLRQARNEQQQRDAASQPDTLLSTMGALRIFSELVFDRHDRNWPDAMVVVLLRDLGVEISVPTLRVYRGRLRTESNRPVGRTPMQPRDAAPGQSPAVAVQVATPPIIAAPPAPPRVAHPDDAPVATQLLHPNEPGSHPKDGQPPPSRFDASTHLDEDI